MILSFWCMVRLFRPYRCRDFSFKSRRQFAKADIFKYKSQGNWLGSGTTQFSLYLPEEYSAKWWRSPYKPPSSKRYFKKFISCVLQKCIKTKVQLCLAQGKSDFNESLISLGFGFPISSKMPIPFVAPNCKVSEFLLFQLFTSIWYWQCSGLWSFKWVDSGVSCFNLHLPDDMIWSICLYAYLLCIFSLEMSWRRLPIFKLGYSCCWVLNFLGILWIIVLYQTCLLQIPYPYLWLVF